MFLLHICLCAFAVHCKHDVRFTYGNVSVKIGTFHVQLLSVCLLTSSVNKKLSEICKILLVCACAHNIIWPIYLLLTNFCAKFFASLSSLSFSQYVIVICCGYLAELSESSNSNRNQCGTNEKVPKIPIVEHFFFLFSMFLVMTFYFAIG